MMKKWLKTTIVLVILAAVIAGSIFGYNAYKNKKAIDEKYDVKPSLVKTSINDLGLYISVSGNISESEDISVYTASYGRIIDINTDLGGVVKKGDILARIDNETLLEDIKTLEDDIFEKKLEIDTGIFSDDTYYIKSPIDGEVKDIKVRDDDEDTQDINEASDIKDIMEEYGYLALVSPEDKMYIVTEESADFLTVGNNVTVRRYDYEYDGVVEKIEEGRTYVLIENDNLSIGRKAYIYHETYSNRVSGITMLYDYIEITPPIPEGEIVRVDCFKNEYVNRGEVLFKISTRSQNMIDLYAQLDELNAELKEKQLMLENLDITAPIDGIVIGVSIEDDMEVVEDYMAFQIADTSKWLLQVPVDELDINQLKLGMKAEVTIDAYSDETFQGVIKAISSVGVASSGVTSYDVFIEIDRNDIFKLNMTANAEIEVQFVEDVLCVPVEALRYIGERSFVMVYASPTAAQVDAKKRELIQAEKMLNSTSQDLKDISKEDMAAVREKLEAARESGDKPQGSGQGELGADKSGGLKSAGANMIILSIADKLYGTMTVVEVGLINETYAQIISGLDEGVQIIIPQSDSASKVDSQRNAFAGMGRAFK